MLNKLKCFDLTSFFLSFIKVVEAKDIDSCWDKLTKTNADGIRYVIDIKKSLENKDYIPNWIF